MQHTIPRASGSTSTPLAHPTQSPHVDNIPKPTVVPNCRSWDHALTRFFKSARLVQTLRGFENDMVVMNLDSEKEDILPALDQLRNDLFTISRNAELTGSGLEERKLEYVHLANGGTPVSHTQLTRSVSAFIAQNRARNNTSNRHEFLRKRRVDVSADTGSSTQVNLPTCARTDAVPVNRDVQMKYDVAKNEDGPLRRTVKSEQTDVDLQQTQEVSKGEGSALNNDSKPTLQRHPGLGERFTNLETHLAVRYVPSPPASLLDRIRFIEDHVVRLERDYPPWAALHFNQPNRGWPPPPRTTPLIVPSHLTSTLDALGEDHTESRDLSNPISAWRMDSSRPGSRGGTAKPRAKVKTSSLHKAVMQRLEVKKALAGED